MPGQLLVAGPYRPGLGMDVGVLTDAEFDILQSIVGSMNYFAVQHLPRAADIEGDGIVEVPLRPTLVRRSRLWNDEDLDEIAGQWADAEEMAGEYRADELHRALVALRQAAGPMGSPDDVRLVFVDRSERESGDR